MNDLPLQLLSPEELEGESRKERNSLQAQADILGFVKTALERNCKRVQEEEKEEEVPGWFKAVVDGMREEENEGV